MSEEAKPLLEQYWHQILFAIGVIAAWGKTMQELKDLKDAVYDDHGDTRLVPRTVCERCREECDRRITEERANTRRELQNIHESISNMQNSISNMPQKIAEHLRTLGLV